MTRYDRFSDLYDLVHKGALDVAFYTGLAAASGGPVLELGCGTGRVLLPVARSGVEVWGLDIAEGMLDICRSRLEEEPPEVRGRVRLHRQDMAAFSLDCTFPLVYIPYRAFLELHEPARQVSCLEAISRHLEPGGRLALSFFQPDFAALRDPDLLRGTASLRLLHADHVDPKSGLQVLAWSSMQFDPLTQVCREVRTYETMDERGLVVQRRHARIDLRWMFRWEMEHLLHRCGFEVESLHGGFEGEQLTAASRELVWVARRRG